MLTSSFAYVDYPLNTVIALISAQKQSAQADFIYVAPDCNAVGDLYAATLPVYQLNIICALSLLICHFPPLCLIMSESLCNHPMPGTASLSTA